MTATLARWVLPLALLTALVLVALGIGKFAIAPADLFAAIGAALTGRPGASSTVDTVLWNVRLPRIAAACAVGAALAAAGTAYQSLFRNPIVSPDILGVAAGAGLGAVLGIFLALPVALIQTLAFLGGLAAVLAVYMIGSAVRGHDPVLVLVLGGIAVGTLLGSAISLLKVLADPYNQLPAITFWLLGSLAGVTPGDLASVALPLAIGLVVLWLLRWRLNLLTLGEEEARALGVEAGIVRAGAIVGATLVTAAAVSITGIIGWVGLVVPHMARLLVGPEMTRLLPLATLLGASFLLAVDTIARTAAPIEVPLGILTGFVGAPVFLWLLASVRRSWS
jgi:iron complex transport system permease protein